jgi:hypothetical protein
MRLLWMAPGFSSCSFLWLRAFRHIGYMAAKNQDRTGPAEHEKAVDAAYAHGEEEEGVSG